MPSFTVKCRRLHCEMPPFTQRFAAFHNVISTVLHGKRGWKTHKTEPETMEKPAGRCGRQSGTQSRDRLFEKSMCHKNVVSADIPHFATIYVAIWPAYNKMNVFLLKSSFLSDLIINFATNSHYYRYAQACVIVSYIVKQTVYEHTRT